MSDLIQRIRIGIHTSADEQSLRNEAADRIEALEAALRTLIASYDAGRRVKKFGVSGMTVQTNIQSSWIHNVEAWAVEEARWRLQGRRKMSDETKKVLAQLEDAWSFLRDPMIKLAIDEINRLQDEIKYLNDLIYPEHNPFLYTMSLTQQEAALLFAMYRTEKCSQEHLDMAMEVVDTKRSSDESAVSGRVKVTICNLRKKLAFYDVDVINYRNFGYGITADHKAKLKDIIEKGAAAGRIPLRQSR